MVGFKSYVYFFYGRKLMFDNFRYSDEVWLFSGEVDKLVYVVIKNICKVDWFSWYL